MPTAYKGTAAEVRALDCYIKLLRASDTVAARIREQVAAFGLTEAQFAVLEAVYHAGSLRATEIARKVLRSGANVTTVLDNLEKQGALKRCECPNDRRAIHVKLTPEGEEQMRRVDPGWNWGATDLPRTKPFYTSLLVGADGRTWVAIVPETATRTGSVSSMGGGRGGAPGARPASRDSNEPAQPALYDVFEPSGVYLGRVQVPPTQPWNSPDCVTMAVSPTCAEMGGSRLTTVATAKGSPRTAGPR